MWDISDPIEKAIIKYENHPSIIKINETHAITDKFSFSTGTRDDVQKIVNAVFLIKSLKKILIYFLTLLRTSIMKALVLQIFPPS